MREERERDGTNVLTIPIENIRCSLNNTMIVNIFSRFSFIPRSFCRLIINKPTTEVYMLSRCRGNTHRHRRHRRRRRCRRRRSVFLFCCARNERTLFSVLFSCCAGMVQISYISI